MRAFIPLVFTLPMALLYLANEDPDTTKTVSMHIHAYPLLANGPFFNDIVGAYLPADIRQSSQAKDERHGDQKSALWKAASMIMSKWMQLWMEEPAYSGSLDKPEG
jgi:hypothetical protein